MAKNKSIFVEGFMDSFSEDKRVEREKKAKAERKKEEAERKKEEARGSERTEEDARGTEGTNGTIGTGVTTVTNGTGGTNGTKGERGARGDGWRKVNRPVQKTIFFDKETSMKLNMLKEMQGKPVQDVIYDIVRGWLDENYEEAIKG